MGDLHFILLLIFIKINLLIESNLAYVIWKIVFINRESTWRLGKAETPMTSTKSVSASGRWREDSGTRLPSHGAHGGKGAIGQPVCSKEVPSCLNLGRRKLAEMER